MNNHTLPNGRVSACLQFEFINLTDKKASIKRKGQEFENPCPNVVRNKLQARCLRYYRFVSGKSS